MTSEPPRRVTAAAELPRAGIKERFRGLQIDPVPKQPDAPFTGQYKGAHQSYAKNTQRLSSAWDGAVAAVGGDMRRLQALLELIAANKDALPSAAPEPSRSSVERCTFIVDAGPSHSQLLKYAVGPDGAAAQVGCLQLIDPAARRNLRLAEIIQSGDYSVFYAQLNAALRKLGRAEEEVYIGGTGGVRRLREHGEYDAIDAFTHDVHRNGPLGANTRFDVIEGLDEARSEWAAARALFAGFFASSGHGEVQLLAGSGTSVQLARAGTSEPPISVSLPTHAAEKAIREKGREAVEPCRLEMQRILDASSLDGASKMSGSFVCATGFAEVAQLGFGGRWLSARELVPLVRRTLDELFERAGDGWAAALAKWGDRVHELLQIGAAGCLRLSVILPFFEADAALFFGEAPPAAVEPPKLCWAFGHFLTQVELTEAQQEAMGAAERLRAAQLRITSLAHKQRATSRTGHLVSLPEAIGPPPADYMSTWTREWEELRVHAYQLSTDEEDRAKANREFVRREKTLAHAKERFARSIDESVQYGMERGNAEIFHCLQSVKSALGVALHEGRKCYARSTYALCAALFHERERQRRRAEEATLQGAREAGLSEVFVDDLQEKLPPPMYKNLEGVYGLVEVEERWRTVTVPDESGFCGLTATAMVTANDRQDCFGERGYLVLGKTEVRGSIVCFEPGRADEHGEHAPIVTKSSKQEDGAAAGTARASYASKEYFAAGLDDILLVPMLTMAQEFSREYSWTDWKGASYTLHGEWEYVNGPAVSKPGCTPGHRDEQNHGVTVERFLRRANDVIAKGREALRARDQPMLREDDAHLTRDEVLAVRLYSGPAYQVINRFLREIANMQGEYRTGMAQHPNMTYAATVGHLCRAIRKLSAVVSKQDAERPLYRGVRGVLPNSFWMRGPHGLICATDTAFMSTSRNRDTPIRYMGEGINVLWQLQPQLETDDGFHHGADISILSQFAGEEEVLFPPCTMLAVQEKKVHGRESVKTATTSVGDPVVPEGLSRELSRGSGRSLLEAISKVKDVQKSRSLQAFNGNRVAEQLASTHSVEKTEQGRTFVQINVLPTFV